MGSAGAKAWKSPVSGGNSVPGNGGAGGSLCARQGWSRGSAAGCVPGCVSLSKSLGRVSFAQWKADNAGSSLALAGLGCGVKQCGSGGSRCECRPRCCAWAPRPNRAGFCSCSWWWFCEEQPCRRAPADELRLPHCCVRSQTPAFAAGQPAAPDQLGLPPPGSLRSRSSRGGERHADVPKARVTPGLAMSCRARGVVGAGGGSAQRG